MDADSRGWDVKITINPKHISYFRIKDHGFKTRFYPRPYVFIRGSLPNLANIPSL
jgi:hypothetical protein